MAAEVKDFDATKYMDRKEAKRMDLFCQYGLAAAIQAVEDSGITQKIQTMTALALWLVLVSVG